MKSSFFLLNLSCGSLRIGLHVRHIVLAFVLAIVTACAPADSQVEILKRTRLIYLSQSSCSELPNDDIESPECQSFLKANSNLVLRVPQYFSGSFRIGISSFDVVRDVSLVLLHDRIVAFDGKNYVDYNQKFIPDAQKTPRQRQQIEAAKPVRVNNLEFVGGLESEVSLAALKRRIEASNINLGEYKRTISTLDEFEMFRPSLCVEAIYPLTKPNYEVTMPVGCSNATIFFLSETNRDIGVICQNHKTSDNVEFSRPFCRLHGQFELRLVKEVPFYISYSYPVLLNNHKLSYFWSPLLYTWVHLHGRLVNWFKSMDVTDKLPL